MTPRQPGIITVPRSANERQSQRDRHGRQSEGVSDEWSDARHIYGRWWSQWQY